MRAIVLGKENYFRAETVLNTSSATSISSNTHQENYRTRLQICVTTIHIVLKIYTITGMYNWTRMHGY